jgi:pSer/pThr/pTyr-binding forkhead associated (FHA) protein
MRLLRRIEKTMDDRLRSIFSGGREAAGSREAIELYRDALEQIASRATAGKRGGRMFPFNLITVELAAGNAERRTVLEALFDTGPLVDDIRATLKEEGVTPPGDLTVFVRYSEDATVEFRVICERTGKTTGNTLAAPVPASVAAPLAMRAARIVTTTGISSALRFDLNQPRVNLGRESEVVDSLGRTIRRNDLYFVENAHEANASVSRSHAHIRFEAGDWRIYDDGSSIGTGIVREGRLIAVPAHGSRGVALRAGDEIYLGQVRLRFEPDQTDASNSRSGRDSANRAS